MNATRWGHGILLVGLIPLLAWNGIVQSWNDSSNDVLARLAPARRSPCLEQIVLLAIDDRTVNRWGPLPLKRDIVARGLRRLAAAHPQTLVVDLLLSEPSASAADEALASVLQLFPKVVLAAALEADRIDPRWILPLALFPRDAVGHVHANPDPDGVVRSIMLAKSGVVSAGRDQGLWALSLEAARTAGQRTLPKTGDGVLWIRYARVGAFRTVPFDDVLQGQVDDRQFAGKIVLLGVSAQGAGDRRFTPVSSGSDIPGIEIHAHAMRTLLDEDGLRPLSPLSVVVLLLGTQLLAAFAGRRRHGRLAAAGFLAIPAASYLALLAGWIVPLASWSIAYGAAAFAGTLAAVREARAGRAEYALRLQAIAHEIKTPLTAISASSEMIADATMPAERKAAVASLIHRESERLSRVVGAFLDVERISAGMLQLKRGPVDLAAVAREAIARANLLALRKHIVIREDLRPAPICGDAELLGFAVYNLLTNALKYSPGGSMVAVTVSTPDGKPRITVGDEGSGIEPEERSRIFERFYRQPKHSTAGPPGSGIGLALVKEIVAQHGGDIEVESKPGRGSQFSLEFPESRFPERENYEQAAHPAD